MHVNSSDKNLAFLTALPKIFHQFSNTKVAQCARKNSLSAFFTKKDLFYHKKYSRQTEITQNEKNFKNRNKFFFRFNTSL